MMLLHPIKYKWDIIGEQLEVCYGDIKSAEYNEAYDHTRKLSEVLQIWIDKRTCQVCWRTIISVVVERPVENKAVADEIYQFLARPDIQNDYLSSNHQTGKMIFYLFNNYYPIVVTLGQVITTFTSPPPIPSRPTEKKGIGSNYIVD